MSEPTEPTPPPTEEAGEPEAPEDPLTQTFDAVILGTGITEAMLAG